MNPVKASIVSAPNEYKYSSYNDFINNNGILDEEIIKLIFGSEKDYIEVFKFIHYGFDDCMEYKEDIKTLNEVVAKEKIEEILNKYNLSQDELKDRRILRYFLKIFKKEKITNYHIEKNLHIDHRKVNKIFQDEN
jgi:hypothetical protein